MDLTPGRQRLLFVVIVIVLVGLGAYIIASRHSGSGTAASSSGPASPAPASSGPASSGVPPSAVPSATPVSTAGGAEIYQWLPFSAAQLSQAVNTTDAFAAAYATWDYKESSAAYGATLKNLVTSTELPSLENAYDTAGVAQPRKTDQQVSTGSGSIDRIFAFGAGPVSITFVVEIDQQVTSKGSAPDKQVSHWNVTVQQSGTGWLVSDFELQGLGNS